MIKHQPDVSKHDPNPHYIRALLERADVSQKRAAKLLGIGDRSIRYYCNPSSKKLAPYLVQYALEMLCIAVCGKLPKKLPKRLKRQPHKR